MGEIKTTNILCIDGNWGDFEVSVNFTEMAQNHLTFAVTLKGRGTQLFTIPELREILGFAEAEFERLANAPTPPASTAKGVE